MHALGVTVHAVVMVAWDHGRVILEFTDRPAIKATVGGPARQVVAGFTAQQPEANHHLYVALVGDSVIDAAKVEAPTDGTELFRVWGEPASGRLPIESSPEPLCADGIEPELVDAP